MTATATDILPINRPQSVARIPCAHCGLDVPTGLIDPSDQNQFCCAGCRAVFQTLHACGLEDFYRLRETAGQPVKPSESKFASFDTPAFHTLYVHQSAPNTFSADLVLEGVTCAACVWLIERLPHVVPGVIEARLSLRQSTVRVTWDDRHVKLSHIAAALNRLGYIPHPAKGISRSDVHRRQTRKFMVDLAVAAALMGNTMLVGFALYSARFNSMEPMYLAFFRWISAILGITSLALPGSIFFRGAISALRVRRINLDVPIALALLVGGTAGLVNVILNRGEIYFDTLTVLVFLLLVGRFLQFRQQRYADDAVELLFSLAPATCRIIHDNVIDELPIEALAPGDLIEIRSGETVAADGVVETGSSSILQALLTGESLPTPVAPGAEVFAGSQNQGAALRVRVKCVGEDSRMGRLMRIVERGIAEKPSIVQLADRIGAYFVAILSLAAAGTFLFWSRFSLTQAIDHSVALLIVSCPCVLGLATPLTLAMTIGQLARRDILVKSGAAIEKLARHGHLLLDKTGTLTTGRLQLLHWHGPEELKPLVAKLEKQSQHPIARALVEALSVCSPSPGTPGEGRGEGLDQTSNQEFRLDNIEDRGSGGVSALFNNRASTHKIQIGSPTFIARSGITIPDEIRHRQSDFEHSALTVVLIAIDNTAVALAALGDRVRDDSANAIFHLRQMHWHPQILSGDAQPVVAAVARTVGIESNSAHGAMTPEAKLTAVRESRKSAPVLMVGDGVNDAAALAAADVGIAVHGGAEASLAAADVYIAAPGLTPLAYLVDSSRRTLGVIHRNLLVSLAYNLFTCSLAAAGKMNPLICAILMPISSASVLALAIASVRRIGRRDILKGAHP